jgi:hypothetical protein
LNSGAPLLDTHDSSGLAAVIGVVVQGSAKIEGGRGVATVKLSSAASDSDAIGKIRDGAIKNISVWYLIHASTRIDSDTPVVEVSDCEPLEVTAVPDPGAQIRKHGSDARPLSKQIRRFKHGAAEATRLLQSTRSRAEAKGAQEAKELLGNTRSSSFRTEAAKPATFDATEVARGARAARRLLRKAK